MCIQLPPSASLANSDDTTGSLAMGQLAQLLDEAGFIDVDVTRLTARIPVIMNKFQIDIGDGNKLLIECDLSMQNPLACMNTSLLLSYSNIIPEIKILAAVIKRWAKSRDINSPQHHTLSSYGYILMLIHFLTTHGVNKNGALLSLFPSEDSAGKHKNVAINPIIPNLQWMDQHWLLSPPGTPYVESLNKPSNQFTVMRHPTEPSYNVNTYFFRLADERSVQAVQARVSIGQKNSPSLALLLASFFRYYAHEFDYKKHVVTLNATMSYGPVEREAKAESDGWKLYGQSLCIEDPFEAFYDVAHVLKPSTFQRTRREFMIAYSKIAEAVRNSSAIDLIELICEPVIETD